MRSFSMPKMAISLLLAILASVILIGINETGYNRSTGMATRRLVFWQARER